MIFPGFEGEAVWTGTNSGGGVQIVRGKANRLGVVRRSPAVDANTPGIDRGQAKVTYRGLAGDIAGTADVSFWHCVTPVKATPEQTTFEHGFSPVDVVVLFPSLHVRNDATWK